MKTEIRYLIQRNTKKDWKLSKSDWLSPNDTLYKVAITAYARLGWYRQRFPSYNWRIVEVTMTYKVLEH